MTRGEIEKFLKEEGVENPAPALVDYLATYLEVRDSIIKREMQNQKAENLSGDNTPSPF